MRIALLPLLASLAAPAFAADNVTLKSDVFVARVVKDTAGRASVVLHPPTLVTPGDKLVFVLNYKNQGSAPATGFTVTNPIPTAVAYANQASVGEVVSIDGARSWGALATLRVRAVDGTSRPAAAADVTHVRWTLKAPIAPGAGGKLQFDGVVR